MDSTPLVILCMSFCSLYGLLVCTASLYNGKKLNIRKDYSYTPKVSVMIAAFNEGRSVYETISALKRVNYPSHLVEIVAFNDCSVDDTWDWMLKAQAEFEGVRVFTNPHNMGKAPTMANASAHTTGEVIICTDADTIFDPDAIRELVCCLSDRSVGAVGGSIGIENVNDSLLSQMQTISYAAAFWLFKPMENFRGAVQCLGGPLVAFRREIYLDIVPEVLNRNFFGEVIHNGEDRFITQCVLLRGWKTYVNLHARCWVGTPTSWGNFFKQQLRWRRSALGQFLYALITLPTYLRKAGFLTTVGSLVPIMTNVAWLLVIVWMVVAGNILPMLASLLVLKLLTAPVFVSGFNHISRNSDPSQVVKNPILSAMLMPIWFVISTVIVTPWALCTLDDGGWVTRQDGLTGNA